MNNIKVMIVDDSAVVRQVLSGSLSEHAGIEVIGTAADPLFALDKMQRNWPDVIVLDVEMPRMDGITFLKKLMAEHPTPVVICSTLTERGAATTMEAMAAGAVAIVTKPQGGLRQFLLEATEELVSAIRAASQARLKRLTPASPPVQPTPKLNADAILAPGSGNAMTRTTERIIALGTSTGGTQPDRSNRSPQWRPRYTRARPDRPRRTPYAAQAQWCAIPGRSGRRPARIPS